MTTKPTYECDVTGKTFESKSDTLEFEVKRHGPSPFEINSRTVHISKEALNEFDGRPPIKLEYIGVEEGEILGAVIPTGIDSVSPTVYRERDDMVIDHFEPFFQLIEEEVLF